MPKLLADFLQEQQEPFALEVYLVERGYKRAICNTLRTSAKYVVPNCSYFLRVLFSQFVVADVNGGRKIFPTEKSKKRRENAGEDGGGDSRCYEAAIRRFDKCGNCFLEGEVDANKNSRFRDEEDCKQLSHVSVLGDTESDQDSPIHYKGESSRRYGFQESRELNQHIINKTNLQQKKQLVIDCTQELIEIYRKKEKNRDEIKAIFGVGEIWKHVCKNVRKWSQDSITETNMLHLLHSESLASIEGWNVVYEQQKFEISMEIEDDILENVISEIITWYGSLVRFGGIKNVNYKLEEVY